MTESPAFQNLRDCQEQLDMDGCMVGVSRQAVEEVLAEYQSTLSRATAAEAKLAESVASEAVLFADLKLCAVQHGMDSREDGGRHFRVCVCCDVSTYETDGDFPHAATCICANPSPAARALLLERERLKRASEALRLVLPMAKGYAAEHRVGSNAEYIVEAESAIAEIAP